MHKRGSLVKEFVGILEIWYTKGFAPGQDIDLGKIAWNDSRGNRWTTGQSKHVYNVGSSFNEKLSLLYQNYFIFFKTILHGEIC